MIYLECAIFASLLIVVAVSMCGGVRRAITVPRQDMSELVEEAITAGALVAIVFIAMMRF